MRPRTDTQTRVTTKHFTSYTTLVKCNEEVHRRTDQPPLASSVPPALNSSVTLHMPIYLWTTAQPLVPVWPLCHGTGIAGRADRVSPGSGPLNPISTTQHWSGNCLSSRAESSSLEHARRNGNIQHPTSHTLMTMSEERERADTLAAWDEYD